MDNKIVSQFFDSQFIGDCCMLLQGTDCRVFFLNVQDNCSPLGFIITPSPVTSLEWTPADFVRIFTQGFHVSWKVLGVFPQFSRPWKVPEN